jgi:hypothetical protein
MMQRKDKIKALQEFIQTGTISLPALHGLPDGIVLIPMEDGTYTEHSTGTIWKDEDINPAMCKGNTIYIKEQDELIAFVTLCI